jgi:hypothetical protein
MCLRQGRVFEANLSPNASTFRIRLFSQHELSVQRLRTGECFRLFHSDSDSFVQSSCNSDKVLWAASNFPAPTRSPTSRQARSCSASKRRGDFPAHIPYLKSLPDTGEDPDPYDAGMQTSKGIWQFELLQRNKGGLIRLGATPVR